MATIINKTNGKNSSEYIANFWVSLLLPILTAILTIAGSTGYLPEEASEEILNNINTLVISNIAAITALWTTYSVNRTKIKTAITYQEEGENNADNTKTISGFNG